MPFHVFIEGYVESKHEGGIFCVNKVISNKGKKITFNDDLLDACLS